MAANGNSTDFRDYVRVIFARGWWFGLVTLGTLGLAFFYSFYVSTAGYTARNEITVSDRNYGSLPKDIVRGSDWIRRTTRAELDLKRSVNARSIITEAAGATGKKLSEADAASMVDSFSDDLKVVQSKEGSFIKLSYSAADRKLAAAVLSLFIKRMIASCVIMQVQELNAEVETLLSLKERLSDEVAAAEKKLDEMKTVAPELRLTATTMALLRSGKDIATMPSTEQAVAVFLELQRDIIMLDGEIADTGEQIETTKREIAAEPEVVPTRRKVEAIPAVAEAVKKRDALRLRMAQLLANSTAEHPLVKQTQAELKSLDAFLSTAATQSTVEVVLEANQKRGGLQEKAAALTSNLAGLQQRRAKMVESAEKWREKLNAMPADLRIVRDATLDYEKKTNNLSLVTDKLVQAQIKRSLEIDQVGTYYGPTCDPTEVPEKSDRPKHALHLVFGFILGIVAGVFVVYAMEFTDHSVKDQRDLRLYTKAAVLGVVSDYNQLKAVVTMTSTARAAPAKKYLLAAVLVVLAALLAWSVWEKWPRNQPKETLPAALSASTVSTIEEAMKMYSTPAADLEKYMGAEPAEVSLTPAVESAPEEQPGPALSE